MPVHAISPAQLTIDFEPGLLDRHATALECVRACVYMQRRGLKAVAADMDLSASELSRKVSGNPDDVRRFSLDDLEAYVRGTGDTTPIEYLAAKYLQSDTARQAHAVAQAQRLLQELGPVLAALKGAA